MMSVIALKSLTALYVECHYAESRGACYESVSVTGR
jgi:hypothetical protein